MVENIRETRLENGLVVLTDRMKGVRSATLGFFFRVGARHEPAELSGITHFIEHCVFKGTARRTALDIAIEQDRLGGNLDAFTTHEETGFAIKVIDDQLDAAFDLIADMLFEPAFDRRELENEQRVIIEEMKMIDDSPEDHLSEIFGRAFFDGDPLGRPIAGTPETVRSFGSEVTREFHSRYFTPASLVIAAAGNVDHDRILDMIEKAGLTGTTGSAAAAEGSVSMSAPIVVQNRADLEQAHMIIAAPFVSARDDRRYAAELLSNIIGGGTSSRLWQKVREERGLAYSVGASASGFENAGVFMVSAGTSPVQTGEVVDLVVAELADIVCKGPTEDELELARQQARVSVLLSLEDSASRAAALSQGEITHGRQIPVQETLDRLASVTLDETVEVAREFIRTDDIAFVALGDLDHLHIDRERLDVTRKR